MVGIYRLKVKSDKITIYESDRVKKKLFNTESSYNSGEFKKLTNLIAYSLLIADLDGVVAKAYTRDLFGAD